jgi:DNA-binding MarR family transcriptional regulator
MSQRPTLTSVSEPVSCDDDPAALEQRVRGIVQSLRVVLGSMQAYSHRIEQQHGISATQLGALWELKDKPGQKVTDLALSLSIHPSNCSNMIDKLRTKGMVRKSRGGPDERVVRLHLTPKASDLLECAPRSHQGPLMNALLSLPAPVVNELESSLSALADALKVASDALKMMRDA